MRKNCFIIENFLFKTDFSSKRWFGYMRAILKKQKDKIYIYDIFDNYDARIKSESSTVINQTGENETEIKYQGFFTIDKEKFSQLEDAVKEINTIEFPHQKIKDGKKDITDDFTLISDRFGCMIEDANVGFSNLIDSPNKLIFAGGLWGRVCTSLIDNCGNAIAEDALFWIGEEQGKNVACKMGKFLFSNIDEAIKAYVMPPGNKRNDIVKQINIDITTDTFVEYNKLQFRSYGYGIIEDIHTENGLVQYIIIKDSFFYEDEKKCAFLAGYFSGYFSLLLSNNISNEETEPNNLHKFEDNGDPQTNKYLKNGKRIFNKI